MNRRRILTLFIGIAAGFALAVIAPPAEGRGDTRRMVECKERCIKRMDKCQDMCDEHGGAGAGKCKGMCKTIEDKCNQRCDRKNQPYQNFK